MSEHLATNRPSGTITIAWEDFTDDEEPNFRWNLHWDPPLDRADHSKMAWLLRMIADVHEADGGWSDGTNRAARSPAA